MIGDFDFFGAQRIVDQTIDIGAHEYNSLDSHIEISSNEICIRPNPFVHMVIIDGDFTSFQIEILDIHGNVVSNYSNSSAPLNINLDHLGSGIFLLKSLMIMRLITGLRK